jgi:molybdate transport system permease protein
VQIYNHVEAMDYSDAHWLAGVLLVFSFAVLLTLYTVLKTQPTAHQLK